MKNKKLLWQLPFLIFLVIGTVYIISNQEDAAFQDNKGRVFGTFYQIKYQSSKDLHAGIIEQLDKVDRSLSVFNKQSVISKINNNEQVVPDTMFLKVFESAQRISGITDGAFDITVAPLVNAWGFGFKEGTEPEKHVIDSLMQIVGYENVWIEDGKIIKKYPETMIDCGGIAKGYSCDVVADYLRANGVENFLVNIGGEIVTSGINDKRVPWKIQVTKPVDDNESTQSELQALINVTDKAMATSGNYRNFYYKGGKKYAHTIDPSTGYCVQHNILSATVLADRCVDADAYATAFMVMGLEKAKIILEKHPEIMAYLICDGKDGSYDVWCSPSLKDKIQE